MWYSSGTVTVENGSAAVIGDGTAFLSNVRVGDGIAIEGSLALHEVINVASEVGITIKPAYQGVSSVGMRFTVVPVLGYDKDLSDAFNRIRLEMGVKVQGLQPWAYADSAVEARNDLELGTAATRDVGTAVGNLLEVNSKYFGVQSYSDFPNGTLIRTSFPAANTGPSITLKVWGKGYAGGQPHLIMVEAYQYNGGWYPNSGINLSGNITNVTIMELDGYVCFWFARTGYWSSFFAEAYDTTVPDYLGNRVTSIGDSTKPEGTKVVDIPLTITHNTRNILQTTGQSTEYPMTQKAVTDAINGVSDRRDKIDVTPNSVGLELIEKLEPVCFKLNKRDWYRTQAATSVEVSTDEDGNQTEHEKIDSEILSKPLSEYDTNDGSLARDDRYTGLIAQDVKAALEDLGLDDLAIIKNYSDEYERGDDRHYIEYMGLIPIMINAIKELSDRVKVLEGDHDS